MVAARQDGIAELIDKIEAHHAHLVQSGEMAHFEENKSATHFTELLKDALFRQVYSHLHADNRLAETIQAIARREVDPYSAVEQILQHSLKLDTE